jgi:phenylacetate-CoA ligase
MTAAGVTSNDILQIELDPGLTNWGRDYKDGAEAIEASVIPLTLLPVQKGVMILRDYRTTVLVISPSAAIQLADHLFKANLNPNALALKTLILVGEPPNPMVIAQLESQLHVRAWVHYGLSEVPGPAVAFECEERTGLHVNEDHSLPEVVDPETGELVLDGQEGELILTTLSTRAFPLIRFRTGDRVRLIPGTCPCGRTLRRIEWSVNRVDDMRVVRGVKLHHDQILLLLQKALGFTPAGYRFIIKRENLQDGLEVWLRVDENLFSDEVKGMEKLSLRLGTDLAQELGIPVAIRFKEPFSIEDSTLNRGLEDLRHQAAPGE